MSGGVSRRSVTAGLVAAPAAVAGARAASAGSTPTVPRMRPSTAERHLDIVSPALLEPQARAAIPDGCFEYIHGAAGDGWTAQRNVARLRDHIVLPRRMQGFVEADTRASFFGVPVDAPLYVCPMGAQDYANAASDVASARGAAMAGIPYMLSGASNRPMEEVARAVPESAMRVFAIYLNRDPAVNRALALRAKAAGYRVIVMTVDALGPGTSERFIAMGTPKTTVGGYGNFDPAQGGTGDPTAMKHDFAPADIAMLKQTTGLPVVVKGLLRPDDTERAIAAGADGVIVSNHGGRTLDGAPAAIDALGPVVSAAKGRVPVLFDSGVRRGTDVIRALALGASAVGIGRPVLDALALGGAQGVADMLDWFRKDLKTQMLLAGLRDIAAARQPGVLAPA